MVSKRSSHVFRVLGMISLIVWLVSCSTSQKITGKDFLNKVYQETEITLHTQELGRGDAVVLLHGFGGSSYTWRYLLPSLSASHKLIMVDLKGFGNSPKPLDKEYSLYDQALLIYDIIRKKDLKEITLVGHSFGGSVALALAGYLSKHAPERIGKLVLIDSVGTDQPFPLIFAPLRIPWLNKILIHVIPEKIQVRQVLKASYYDDRKILDSAITVYAEDLKADGAKHALLETMDQLLNTLSSEFTSWFSLIKVPTLIIWGENDRITPLTVGEQLDHLLPNSILHVIEKCGHIPHEEKPEAVLPVLRKFFEGKPILPVNTETQTPSFQLTHLN